jgi:hypothetical protein
VWRQSNKVHAEKNELERKLESDLRGQGDSDSSAGPEEVAQGASGNEQLLATGDRHGARRIRTKSGDICEIVYRNGQSADIADVIVAGIAAVEEVEEFDKGYERPVLMELDGTAHAQISLDVGRATELVETGFHSVNHHAIACWSCQRNGPPGLCLREETYIESCRAVNSAC